MAEFLNTGNARVMVPDAVVALGRDAVGTFADAIEAGISADDAAVLVLPTRATDPTPAAAPIADEPPTEDDV